LLLFFVLSCDTLIHYRIRLIFAGAKTAEVKA
jgi:simple sugar transport system permease protein